MIRLQPLPLETDVLPQAIFWRPILYFSPKIREDEDGLDRFRVITFTIDNRLTFDLRNYRGHPTETVTVYFPFDMQKEEELVAALQLVVAQTGVSKRAVAWQRGWDFEYGSLQRQTLDRLREPEARVLALKIAALCPNHAASTEQIKQALWQQIVGNVVSHHKTASGLFGMGYAVRTRNGIRVTERGLGYLNRIGFSV